MMDPSVISALSAVLGSLVGGSASIATAWFTQTTQGRRDRINTETVKRETLYSEFIAECVKLNIDSLDHALDQPATLAQAYAVLNRIRLRSSPAVVDAGANVIRTIVARYAGPKLTLEQIQQYALSGENEDPLKKFAEACRKELAEIRG
ncbi:MAG TPA: hypothetical protein VLW55_21290 [Burkholderiaceae bacterium]|nr:hypothetical protein [Burkholderiaceae bacterium]